MLLSVPAFSQTAQLPDLPAAGSGDLTLGGVPQLLADKLTEAKPAAILSFGGHPGAAVYLPILTFHDQAGKNYVEAVNLGYRAIEGAAPRAVIMPLALNVTAISGRVWNFEWANLHVTRSKFPDVFLGVTALVPFDAKQVKAMKLNKFQDWTAAVASVRFK